MRGTLVLLATLAGCPALAGDECAKYEAPLAYNACLARQGPPARAVSLGHAAPSERAPHLARNEAPPSAYPVRHAPRVYARRTFGRIMVARTHGRAELVFTPTGR